MHQISLSQGVFINPEDCGSYFVCNDNGAGLKVEFEKTGLRFTPTTSFISYIFHILSHIWPHVQYIPKYMQATKINCPGATVDGGNVLAFNDVTGSCDWAVNVPGCGGERCYYIYCIDNGYCQFKF